MKFWIFTLLFLWLIPLIMIGFGRLFVKNAPKEINWLFGYRTTMSTKNKDTWEFAHLYFGKLWFSIGWIMFIISTIVMLCVIRKDNSTIEIVVAILAHIQILFLLAPVFPTERALKRNFDKSGNRKNTNLDKIG